MTKYRLRTLRIQDCKRQGDVASYLNISRQYYSEYESTAFNLVAP